MSMQTGEILALVGPNGAGKTSLLNCVSGVYKPASGRILLHGEPIAGLRPHQIARRGIARTFQNVEVFSSMTVRENVMLGRHNLMRSGPLRGAILYGPALTEEVGNLRRVEEVLDLLEIAHLRGHPVGDLPHGVQKRVELGRALAMEPSLLLLDEPVAGMNHEETEDMVRFILDVHDDLRPSILIVEHDMGVVMDISHRVAVLDFGSLIALDVPDQISKNAAVIKAYLGTAGDEQVAATAL
jgi:branched-chain amino acid transport system ATP-binding protein